MNNKHLQEERYNISIIYQCNQTRIIYGYNINARYVYNLQRYEILEDTAWIVTNAQVSQTIPTSEHIL